MTHSKFPWTTHPHTPTAVFDGDGRRIIDQWVAPDRWRPIETAPKNGSHILLFQRDRGAFEGWFHMAGFWMDDRDSEPEPTHWMPLPAPPSDAPAPTPLDPDTAAANAVMIAGLPGLIEALKECVIRLRYDGDLFDNQGNEQRRDASWKAMEMAEAALASIGRTP